VVPELWYDVNQERAAPVIPMPAWRSRSRGCEMLSNAALKMRMGSSPESAARRRALGILTRAVSVLCF